MNESNDLIVEKEKGKNPDQSKINSRVNIKVNKSHLKRIQSTNKYYFKIIIFFLISPPLSLFEYNLLKNRNNNKENENIFLNYYKNEILNKKYGNISSQFKKDNNILIFNIEKSKYENKNQERDEKCNKLDPINIFTKRIKDNPRIVCQNEKSRHICYQNNDKIFVSKKGVICTMENIILDPSKWKDGGFIYKGPVD